MSIEAQRRRASRKSAEIRSARAAIKRQIKAGELELGALLRGDVDVGVEQHAGGIRLSQLLLSVPGIGPDTLSELIEERGVPSEGTLDDLSLKRRGEIAAIIEEALA